MRKKDTHIWGENEGININLTSAPSTYITLICFILSKLYTHLDFKKYSSSTRWGKWYSLVILSSEVVTYNFISLFLYFAIILFAFIFLNFFLYCWVVFFYFYFLVCLFLAKIASIDFPFLKMRLRSLIHTPNTPTRPHPNSKTIISLFWEKISSVYFIIVTKIYSWLRFTGTMTVFPSRTLFAFFTILV